MNQNDIVMGVNADFQMTFIESALTPINAQRDEREGFMKKRKILVSVLIMLLLCGCNAQDIMHMPDVDDTVSQLASAVSMDKSQELETERSLPSDHDKGGMGTDISIMEEFDEEEKEEIEALCDSHKDEKGELLASGECGAEGGNVQYQLYENGNLYIYGSGDMKVFNNKQLFEEIKTNIKRVRIEDGVTSIGQKAFFGCSAMEEIIIPDGITIIRKQAFYGCTSLKSITLPDSVTDIADQAFYECSQMESVVLSQNLKSVPFECFAKCRSLGAIELPQSIESIGGSAFSDCSSIKEIIIPDKVKQIQDFTFMYCFSMEKVTIPVGVTEIGHSAFTGCSKIKDVFFGGDMPVFHSKQIFSDYRNEPGTAAGNIVYLKVHYPSGNTTWESVTKGKQYGEFKGAQVEFVGE